MATLDLPAGFNLFDLAPVGAIVEWPSDQLPSSLWAWCEGQEYSQTTYSALYARCGDRYDTPAPAAGNFRVPDKRGRVAVHPSTDTAFDTLGETGLITVGSGTLGYIVLPSIIKIA